jgi:hypothetical protein
MKNNNFDRIKKDCPKIAELYLHSGDFQESINYTWKYENNESTMLNLDRFLESRKITEDNADLLFEEWSTCHIGRKK